MLLLWSRGLICSVHFAYLIISKNLKAGCFSRNEILGILNITHKIHFAYFFLSFERLILCLLRHYHTWWSSFSTIRNEMMDHPGWTLPCSPPIKDPTCLYQSWTSIIGVNQWQYLMWTQRTEENFREPKEGIWGPCFYHVSKNIKMWLKMLPWCLMGITVCQPTGERGSAEQSERYWLLAYLLHFSPKGLGSSSIPRP